jgi:hypothetical protein
MEIGVSGSRHSQRFGCGDRRNNRSSSVDVIPKTTTCLDGVCAMFDYPNKNVLDAEIAQRSDTLASCLMICRYDTAMRVPAATSQA